VELAFVGRLLAACVVIGLVLAAVQLVARRLLRVRLKAAAVASSRSWKQRTSRVLRACTSCAWPTGTTSLAVAAEKSRRFVRFRPTASQRIWPRPPPKWGRFARCPAGCVTAAAKVRLLVLDDAAVLRTLVARLAEDLGHDVVGSVATVPEALDLLPALRPDAALVDGRIPQAGDIAGVVRRLRAVAPELAICLIAALDEGETVVRAREAGAAGALLRPVTRTGLAAALAALAGAPERRDA